MPWAPVEGLDQEHAAYFRAIRIEKTMMSLILLLVVAVAAFNIVAALVMVVNEKRSDIAILRTLGMTPRGVVGVFLTQGLVIGTVGTLFGLVLGVLIAANVGTIVPVLERVLHFHVMDPSVYYITQIPSELRIGQIDHYAGGLHAHGRGDDLPGDPRCGHRARRSAAVRMTVARRSTPFELTIGRRYLRSTGNRFLSFISLISMTGVAIGVAVLIVVLSVMNGFEHELRSRILSLTSHATITAFGEGLAGWEAMRTSALRKAQPGVGRRAIRRVRDTADRRSCRRYGECRHLARHRSGAGSPGLGARRTPDQWLDAVAAAGSVCGTAR